MKKLLKKTVYICMMGLFVVMLTGCDEKINPEVLAEYAKTVDPETLREYAYILEDVAEGIESGEIEMIDIDDIDLEQFESDGLLAIAEGTIEQNIKDAQAAYDNDEDASEEISEDLEEIEDEIEDELDVEDDADDLDVAEDEDADETEDEDADSANAEVDEDLEKIVEINEQYSLAETLVLDGNNKVYVEYNVPSIDDDTKDAKKINEEIYDFCKPSIDTAESIINGKAKDKTKEPEFAVIDYDVYENDGIVSIVVCAKSSDEENVEYKVVNYNTTTGKKVDDDDILENLDIEEDDLEGYVKKTLGAQALLFVEDEIELVKTLYSEDSEEVASILGTVNAFFQYTLSNIDISDDVMIYIDGDGDPAIIGEIYIPTSSTPISFETKLITDDTPDIFNDCVGYASKYHYPELEMNSILLDEGMKYVFEIPGEYEADDFEYDEVSIGFDEEDSSVFVVELTKDKTVSRYTGTIEIAGFSEKGINFHYELTALNDKALGKKSLDGNFDIMIELDLDENGDIITQAASIAVTEGFDFTGADGEAVLFDLLEY